MKIKISLKSGRSITIDPRVQEKVSLGLLGLARKINPELDINDARQRVEQAKKIMEMKV